MNSTSEWHRLKAQLRELNYANGEFSNQFYSRLLVVLRDSEASEADRLLAFRDALLACPDPDDATLPSGSAVTSSSSIAGSLGMRVDRVGNVSILNSELIAGLNLSPVYRLERRRFIHEDMMDPSLQGRLNNPDFKTYNGRAQKLAVRFAITSERKNTLAINLPTGCGKTLVAHALSLFSGANQLTLVIVPTISLAVEQGNRAAEMLRDANLDHGGLYFWHGGQAKDQHDDIKKKIREQSQRILFCSPEAACRSLLPALYDATDAGSLCNIVVDEAHIVDQWGAEFRPYFQIFAALLSSLRKSSRQGIKCILMSATFTPKSLKLVKDLFAVDGQDCIEVNGSFLRPEIQYGVRRVSQEQHLEAVLQGVVALPKPMIVYTNTPVHARILRDAILRLGMLRVGLFTGETSTDRREKLLLQWNGANLDVMVATSAFGLGMDKADVRSVMHAAVPENLDRFYQEVGRGGRDGLASQSLLIYHSEQIDEARKINRLRLITPELGLEKWKTMWDLGRAISGGHRKVDTGAIRPDQLQPTEGNEEWNWRTLLLMQRAGLIAIEIDRPSPPATASMQDLQEYRSAMRDYFNKFYREVTVTPLSDNHLDYDVWAGATEPRRVYEKREQLRGLNSLLDWMANPQANALCNLLADYYTIDGLQPEYACGGCPVCLADKGYHDSPTVGTLANIQGVIAPTKWRPPLRGRSPIQNVYFSNDGKSYKRLLRGWINWVSRLIDGGTICMLSGDADVLKILTTELQNRTEAFWIGELVDGLADAAQYWPRLILHMDTAKAPPDPGWTDVPTIFMAPQELQDPENPYRKWWESTGGSVSLDNFLHRFNYGNH